LRIFYRCYDWRGNCSQPKALTLLLRRIRPQIIRVKFEFKDTKKGPISEPYFFIGKRLTSLS
jgi:hypothetical protein